MPKIHTTNSMPKTPSCSTLIILNIKNVIPITNYCKTIKMIRNTESNLIGVKLLSKF
jgi:hypothetical protein